MIYGITSNIVYLSSLNKDPQQRRRNVTSVVCHSRCPEIKSLIEVQCDLVALRLVNGSAFRVSYELAGRRAICHVCHLVCLGDYSGHWRLEIGYSVTEDILTGGYSTIHGL